MTNGHLSPAECVFEAMGGVRETARVLGIDPTSVSRWVISRRRRAGVVPIHHIKTLLAEAKSRGKPLTLEHLVFGRDPLQQGVVQVRDGVKIKITMHDTYTSMVNTLTMAGG